MYKREADRYHSAAILVQKQQSGGVYSFLLPAHNLSSRRLLAIVFQKFCQASTFGEPGFHIIPMKVIVNISYCAKAEVKGCDSHDKRLSFAVKPSYTVKRLKQQVMLVESVPFPEQVLELNGMVLADSQRIEDLAVTEGQELDLKVTATTAVFTQQLVDLLKEQTHPVSATELAMLYSHKSGGTVKRALSILGCGSNLIDYISSESKQFSINSGMVSLNEPTITNVAEDEKPLALAAEVVIKSTLGNVVKASLELTVKGCETVQGFAERVAAAELIPFQAVEVSMKGRVLEGSQTLGSYIKEASTVHVQINISKALLLQQLAGLLNGRCLSVTELGDLYCYRYGAPVTRALELLGRRSTLKDFLKDNLEHFSLHAGSVKQREASNNSTVRTTTFGALNQRYLDLDSEITSCKSIEEAEACFELAIQSAAGGSYGIKRVIRGGSLGRGTAFVGNADAEALLLLDGTSPMDRATWLPPLLTEMASTLRKDMTGKADVSVVDDTIHLSFPGSLVVLSFDAVSGSFALAAERKARLFAKMSPATKVTMRLLKWWRNQQNWSNDQLRPCDLVLEELVASTANTSPEDQADAVATVLGALESMEKQAYEESSSPRGYFDNHQLIQLAAQSAGKLIDVK